MILGNKLDLTESRAISRTTGKSLADEHGAKFAEVSAKTGEEIDEVRE